ncbi:MAG: MarC family protein [Kofleriaceae bacterium]|nr:MarC family protein [Kofleriaceae bacterium]
MVAGVLIAFVALIVVVEPLGVIPFFLSLTRGRSVDDRRRIALRASLVGSMVLLAFALFGAAALNGLGIRIDAFRVAGGVILFLTALDMIRQRNGCRCTPSEAGALDDVAVVPLAIPLLAGPASMAAVMELVGREPTIAVVIAIVLVFLVTYLVLRTAGVLHRLLGPVLGVVQRVLGLLLAAMSVQSVIDGVMSLVTTFTA